MTFDATASAWEIRNVTVIDGTGAEPRPDQSVIVADGRIDWVGPSDLAPAMPEERRIGGRGGHLLPGLIDGHVHLTGDCEPDLMAQILGDSIPMGAFRAARNARCTLEDGVTTVRDCGAADAIVIELSRAIASGVVDGPRILAAGRVLTMTGGHGHFVGRQVDGSDSVRHATRAEIAEGADFIKIMSTGGVLTPGVTPGQASLGVDELRMAVETAHNAERRVTTHAIGRRGLANALNAGVDSIEHGFYLDEDLFSQAIDQGTVLIPTLSAVTEIAEIGEEGGIPSWAAEKARDEFDQAKSMFRQAVDSGMRIAAGTDAGTPFNRHSPMIRELEIMVECGLSPSRALVSATADGAANLGLADVTGTIEVGKCADLIVVDGDPLADLRALERIRLVARDGIRFVDRLSGRRGRSD